MNRNTFYNFIRDKAYTLIGYLANTCLLILFYNLFYGKADILYPVLLSLAMLAVIFTIEWYKYKDFNKELPLAISNPNYELPAKTHEQLSSAEILSKLHSNYCNSINELKLESKETRRFISQFIHSMKSPSAVIHLAVQEYKNTADKEDLYNNPQDKLMEIIEDIDKENQRLLQMLDNILNLIRVDEFSTDYCPEPLNLEKYVNKLINARKSSFIYGNVFPKVNCLCLDPLVLTDEKWNGILLEQIISNGIKYSSNMNETKNIHFTISRENNQITLSIKDEGIGIPSYDLPKITTAFFTGENGRKVKNSTGIGLYITSRICEKLGHKLDILSEPGKGTEVRVTYLAKM